MKIEHQAENMMLQSNTVEDKQQFAVQKIYVKASNFESTVAAEMFKREWKPQVEYNLENKTAKLEQGLHEIDLTVSFAIKSDDNMEICHGKVVQSGIFTLVGFNQEQMEHMITSYCPTTLYPFIRESIADMVTRGGYPPLFISPINFDAIYAQLQEEKKQKAQQTGNKRKDEQ